LVLYVESFAHEATVLDLGLPADVLLGDGLSLEYVEGYGGKLGKESGTFWVLPW